jgi:hypothetical protein
MTGHPTQVAQLLHFDIVYQVLNSYKIQNLSITSPVFCSWKIRWRLDKEMEY